MKKTFPVNINGSVFYIDEDAYMLLNTYLEQLHAAFKGEEGNEIVADIEARIAEIFTERVSCGASAIVIDDVNNVIEQMGRPSELGYDNATNAAGQAPGPEQAQQTPPPFCVPTFKKRLFRDVKDKVFGGVLAGIAQYMDWNVKIMRLLVVMCFILLWSVWPMSWAMVIAYLVAWMIIPPARTAQDFLQMNGSPVTVENVGQTILGNAARQQDSESLLTTFFNIVGKTILMILGIGAGVAGIVSLIVLGAVVIALTMHWHYVPLINYSEMNPMFAGFGLMALSLAVIILAIALVWACCCALFKTKGASKGLIISAAVADVVLIALTITMFVIGTEYPDLSFCPSVALAHPAMTMVLVALPFMLIL